MLANKQKEYGEIRKEKNNLKQPVPWSEEEKQRIFLQDLRMEQDEGPR